jgi:hypothetical protein
MAGSLWTQEPDRPSAEAPPGYQLLRYDENYRYLRDPQRRQDFLDDVKYIPLDETGDSYLTLGGEIRERYERFNHDNWGAAPEDTHGYLLERYMAHFDLHAGEYVRVFGQLKSGLEYGRTGGPRPPDRDQGDINQLFVDGVLDWGAKDFLTLRVGRQEMAYGSGRLVDPREGPNVRQSFDAVRALFKVNEWNVSAFVSRPVETNPRAFTDGDLDQVFWGIYGTRPMGIIQEMSVDLYYLGLERDAAEFDKGVAREERHSFGTRLWGKSGGLDYDCELVYQVGSWGDGDIHAWTAASYIGYTADHLPFAPRIGLVADIASGDPNRSSPNQGTFNPLFPTGAYLSEMNLIGPSNLIDVQLSLLFHFTEKITFTTDADWFWRQSTQDGIYGMGVNPVRPGNLNGKRYIGSDVNTFVTWEINRHFSMTLYYGHFFVGEFLEETPPGKSVDYCSAWITFKF